MPNHESLHATERSSGMPVSPLASGGSGNKVASSPAEPQGTPMRGERWLTPWGQHQSLGGPAQDPAVCYALFAHLTDGPGTGGIGQPVASQTPREAFLTRYNVWLQQRKCEVAAMQGSAQQNAARGLLQQVEEVVTGLANGVYPDLRTLDQTPVATDIFGSGRAVATPPLLIPVVRWFIEAVERPAPDRPIGTNPEGSRDGNAQDWNTLLGVSQYRTQSDNLASPEATCNVNALAMVFERLGYGRPDVMGAIERALRQQYWMETLKHKEPPTPEELDAIELPGTYFQEQVKLYLEAEYTNAKERYQRPRGKLWPEKEKVRSSEVDRVSQAYQDSAQMEDLLDFLRYLHRKDWEARSSSTFLKTHANDIIGELDPHGTDRPSMTRLSKGNVTWARVREKMQECLEDGGAAMLSLYHKCTANSEDSHIVAVQRVSSSGLIVDDPYGAIRSTYNANELESDAFAPADNRTHSRTSEYKNQVDEELKPGQASDEVGDDWKVDSAQNLTDEESLGDSHSVPDAVISKAWRYVQLYERPSVVRERTARERAHRGVAH